MNKPARPRAHGEPPIETVRSETPDDSFQLHLDDFVLGAAGEIVLFNDSAVFEFVIATSTAVVDQGEVDTHVTAENVDVSGYRYLRFANGVVLYHDVDTRVVVDAVTE